MHRAIVDFRSRCYMPIAGEDIADPWRWQTYTQRLHIDIPDKGDEYSNFELPPPMFTCSAAWTWRIQMMLNEQGPVFTLVTAHNSYAFRTDWRETELWSEIKFDSDLYGNRRHRAPWSLRWRTINVQPDLLTVIMRQLDAIEYAADDPTTVRTQAQRTRREIMMYLLGSPLTRIH